MNPILETSSPPFVVRQEYLDQFCLLEAENTSSLPPYAAQSLLYGSRNRYDNVFPYQANIFCFENPLLYFNASYVLKGRAICCQGPLETEHSSFWRMVWESHAKAIIMTTDLVEKSKTKCSWYLPSATGETLPPSSELLTDLNINVTQVEGPPKPADKPTPALIERRLELEYKGERRTVYHYHFTGWGDFRAAPEALLAQLVLTVWERHYSKGERLISHCSAGIGRSGTFLATLEAFSQLKKEPNLSNLVYRIVQNLRSYKEGREGMVQTQEQYGLIFKTVALLDVNCARQFCVQSSL
jgi:protein tyrosine phosphatase